MNADIKPDRPSPNLLIIGGVTLDTLHLPSRPGPINVAGGAGLYTALAAKSAGAGVRLFAQVPDPIPEDLRRIRAHLDWTGPRIPLDQLPRLEIVHYGGGKAELRRAFWGAQLNLSPEDLPEDLSAFTTAHVAALGPTAKQIDMVRACRERGVRSCSAGTYSRAVYGERDRVQELIREVDLFFMNENEAAGVFGSPGAVTGTESQVLFVTRGEDGAFCVSSEGRIAVSAPRSDEVDPTGAGDTFCGAVLARLEQGDTLESAMKRGAKLASDMIRGIGPERLI